MCKLSYNLPITMFEMYLENRIKTYYTNTRYYDQLNGNQFNSISIINARFMNVIVDEISKSTEYTLLTCVIKT